MRDQKVMVWLRAVTVGLVILASAFMVYGRLVAVETRLENVEHRLAEVHDKLFPSVAVEE